MNRSLAGLLIVASLVFVPAASAAAVPERQAGAGNLLVAKIVAAQVELEANGTVSVPLRVRCDPSLDAFELDVSVNQGSTFGSVNLIGTPFPACTGRWERITLSVAAEARTFGPGPATVGVFLGAFDPATGRDTSVEDSATVTL